MIEQLIEKFHPSVRDAVACWLRGLPDVGTKRDRAELQADRINTAKNWPAFAVFAAYGVYRRRGADRALCMPPSDEYHLKVRFGRGTSLRIPAHRHPTCDRLRVKKGMKYLTVYAIREREEEKSAE